MTDNRIRGQQTKGRLYLSDGERKTLAETGQKLAKQALEQVATIASPANLLAWYRTLVRPFGDQNRAAEKALGSMLRSKSHGSRADVAPIMPTRTR